MGSAGDAAHRTVFTVWRLIWAPDPNRDRVEETHQQVKYGLFEYVFNQREFSSRLENAAHLAETSDRWVSHLRARFVVA